MRKNYFEKLDVKKITCLYRFHGTKEQRKLPIDRVFHEKDHSFQNKFIKQTIFSRNLVAVYGTIFRVLLKLWRSLTCISWKKVVRKKVNSAPSILYYGTLHWTYCSRQLPSEKRVKISHKIKLEDDSYLLGFSGNN